MKLHEVGMRDGLQMEEQVVSTDRKIEWIGRLVESGLDVIQLGSFVHPVKVPQMADAEILFEHFTQPGRTPDHVVLSGLVLNEKGLERGLSCGVEMFCMGVSASETHSMRNTRMTVGEATARIVAMAKEALAAGAAVQVSVQSAFGCGYEGPVSPDQVLRIVGAYLEAGLRTISLADTAGHAHPAQVEALYGTIFALDDEIDCACHFHNTYGLALANCFAAHSAGVGSFESSVAGLGGCPFTAVAGGNTCTEDWVHALQREGKRLDVDLAALIELARDIAHHFGGELPGSVYRTGPISEPVVEG